MKHTSMRFAAIFLLALAPGAGFAQSDRPDATVELSGGSAALGIGYSWGNGTLNYQGRAYPFTVKGLSVANVGASSVQASGNVYHLAKLEDFDGNYTAVTAGATVGGGAGVAAMQNQHGVVMQLTSTTQGLQFTLAPAGMAVALQDAAGTPAGSSSPQR